MLTSPQKPAYLSDAYWSQMDPLSRELYERIAPLPTAAYTVDVGVGRIESFLASMDSDAKTMGGHLELEPDFQRGHVWSDEQRIQYVEAFVRRIADCKIIFNSPAWSSDKVRGDIPAHVVQCVDGLQRHQPPKVYGRRNCCIWWPQGPGPSADGVFSAAPGSENSGPRLRVPLAIRFAVLLHTAQLRGLLPFARGNQARSSFARQRPSQSTGAAKLRK